MSDPKLIEKAKTLGRLLASSPLALDLKMTILENLSEMPEKYLDALIISLENEAKGIEILLKEAEDFIKGQDADWSSLETKQQEVADKIMAEELAQLDKDAKIDSLKTSLASL